ncbi:hypothetical protein HD553DRAFT_145732 [Filobasidium floriforme]|uniref:uncharacterized protein n=1 Tax=Filobasidium floriforme TaxID=5210 RepID=UPI001E8D65EC|nr:uncharacterized protein HD553DRAFT_145732 [Filobasidium floriforme]KAH8078243.1 hypothetical protein HD553DRAFT_145732 [Filobasidium floriforme]
MATSCGLIIIYLVVLLARLVVLVSRCQFLASCKLSGSGKSYEQTLSKVSYPRKTTPRSDTIIYRSPYKHRHLRTNSQTTTRPPSPNPFASAPRDSGSDEASRVPQVSAALSIIRGATEMGMSI